MMMMMLSTDAMRWLQVARRPAEHKPHNKRREQQKEEQNQMTTRDGDDPTRCVKWRQGVMPEPSGVDATRFPYTPP